MPGALSVAPVAEELEREDENFKHSASNNDRQYGPDGVERRQPRIAPNARTIATAASGSTNGAASRMRPAGECPGRGPQPSAFQLRTRRSSSRRLRQGRERQRQQARAGGGLGLESCTALIVGIRAEER